MYPACPSHGPQRARPDRRSGQAARWEVQPCRASNHVTIRPPPGPPRGQPRHQHQHPPIFRLTITRSQPRHPEPPRSMTSTRTTPLAVRTTAVTVPPETPGPLCRMLLLTSSLTSSAASSPHGCSGPSTPAVNARATRAAPPARPPSRSPAPPPWPSAHPPSPPARVPRNHPEPPAGTSGCTPDSATRVKPGNARQRRPVRGRPWKADGYTDRATGPDAVRYASVDIATHRLTVTHRDTRRDKKKTAPRVRLRSQGAVSAGGGRCWVRTNVG